MCNFNNFIFLWKVCIFEALFVCLTYSSLSLKHFGVWKTSNSSLLAYKFAIEYHLLNTNSLKNKQVNEEDKQEIYQQNLHEWILGSNNHMAENWNVKLNVLNQRRKDANAWFESTPFSLLHKTHKINMKNANKNLCMKIATRNQIHEEKQLTTMTNRQLTNIYWGSATRRLGRPSMNFLIYISFT